MLPFRVWVLKGRYPRGSRGSLNCQRAVLTLWNLELKTSIRPWEVGREEPVAVAGGGYREPGVPGPGNGGLVLGGADERVDNGVPGLDVAIERGEDERGRSADGPVTQDESGAGVVDLAGGPRNRACHRHPDRRDLGHGARAGGQRVESGAVGALVGHP